MNKKKKRSVHLKNSLSSKLLMLLGAKEENHEEDMGNIRGFDNDFLWITGGLDDRFARAVLEGVVGGDGEACHLGVADGLDAGIPDDAAEGD